MNFSAPTRRHLGHYVYALVDPRDDSIFYVGKASGNNRAFDHLKAAPNEGQKSIRIAEIRKSRPSLEPEVQILRYGLDETSCLNVEAAIIDAIGLENLTNEIRGHGVDRGRQTAKEVERLHGSKPVDVSSIADPCMLFFINRTYSPTKSDLQLYDCARQYWYNVSERTRTVLADGSLPYPTALAIADNIVVRAYTVAAWLPAGSTMSSRGDHRPAAKWEFVGQQNDFHRLVGRRLIKDGKDFPANQLGFGYIGIAASLAT